jgi:hypothetical protein
MAAALPRKDLLVEDLIHITPFEPILLSILSAEAAGRRFSKFGCLTVLGKPVPGSSREAREPQGR